MENWASNIIGTIDSKLEGIRDKDIMFYRIEEFKRNTTRIDSFSKSCPFCQQQKINISETTEYIDEAIKVPGKARRDYDRLIGRLSKHMRKEHNFFPPYYYTYLFSFFGFAAGLILGFVFMKIKPSYSFEMASVGFIVCLIPAYYWGYFKDKKIRSEKRLM